ncbi:1,4-dihydroxy-2-naphthoyl-CoA thioesterase 1-like [Phalaenopsis equestris]|uniref:1,4-dihydroxy-2-naphthoyl-CoA thioesterase 1-like n=1 Tax=Phalaenopsis equestris TaxID=78828 RepID=UPI0009E4E2EF|nr:1,4-dihydroxy-2-naphthoyl-CoA thioesterase 1-like [Phalaenopsis equestris]
MAGTPSNPHEKQTPAALTAELDRPLHALGFEYIHFSPEKITGRLTVSESWCQPFKRMHGGVAAFVAEGVASAGAYMASGFQQVAGVQLTVNHISPAFLGDKVEIEATRISLGKTIQVWKVQQWKAKSTGEKVLLSLSNVTLVCNLPSPKSMKSYEDVIKKHSKL